MSGVVRPSGTVTFLFTDIEGSTRPWEADPEAMRVELAAHDDVLRSAIEAHGGWLFKHTGDGVCAAFASARAAVDAAIDAQRLVGVAGADGDRHRRGRTAWRGLLRSGVESGGAGDGGRSRRPDAGDRVDGRARGRVRSAVIWVSTGCGTSPGVEHLFQVRADGLASDFPPLRTIEAVPGNLPRPDDEFRRP